MCKLCNSDTEPLPYEMHKNSKRSIESQQFCSIVEQYTGEYPCKSCNYKYVAAKRLQFPVAASIDDYIWNILKRSYKHPSLTHQHSRWSRLDKKYKESKKTKPQPSMIKQKVIEKNISKFTRNNVLSYKFECLIVNKRITKRFKTLEEAQQFKKEVLNGNYTHTA